MHPCPAGTRWILVAAAFVSFSSVTNAQGTPTLHAESHLVDFTISVHDGEGQIVTDLTRDEVSITEDGVAQTVRFFSRVDELPLNIGLLLDASGSQEKFLKQHENDVADFLKAILLPQDRAFVVCFGNHLRVVSDWSADARALLNGLKQFDKGERNFPELGPAEERDLGTALYDAIYYATEERLAPLHGRTRILVVFSDGEENSSEHDLLDAIGAAENANVLIYAIRYTETKHGAMTARNRYGVRVLDHLSGQTGARSFDAGSMSLRQAFAAIAADARSLYSVAYQSTNHERDGQFRKVVVQTTRHDAAVRARAGYYAR